MASKIKPFMEKLFVAMEDKGILGYCNICGSKVLHNSFEDEISMEEFTISATCQVCQNKIYNQNPPN